MLHHKQDCSVKKPDLIIFEGKQIQLLENFELPIDEFLSKSKSPGKPKKSSSK